MSSDLEAKNIFRMISLNAIKIVIRKVKIFLYLSLKIFFASYIGSIL